MTKLNREDKRHLKVLLKQRTKKIFDSLGDETQELWSEAAKTLGWIHGEPITLPNGSKVDLSMFDFIVAQCDFTPDDMTSDLKMLQKFWVTLFPYTNKMISNMQFYIQKFREVEKIETEVLRKYADQNFELQYRQKFMKEQVPAEYEEKFQEYHKLMKAESDAEIEKIKKREKVFVKTNEKKIERRDKGNAMKRFASKIMSK